MLKKRFLALICGVIFSFGFAPFDLWLISVLSVAVLVGLLNKSSNKEAFLLGYAFGFGMWLSGISWLYVSIHYHGNVSIIGSSLIILIFISILSLYSGFLFLLNNVLESLSPKKIIFLTLPIAWTLLEFLRSYLFTGFPWLISGTMLADTFIDGYTPIIGAQGNSFFLILLSVLVYKLYENITENRSALLLSTFSLLILMPSYFLKTVEWTSAENKIQVSLYQPNLTLEDKWSQFEKDNQPFMNSIKSKSSEKNITLITGILEREDNYRVRNRLQTLGTMEDVYDKVKLVPFGEFIPLEKYLGSFLDIIGLNLTNTLPGEAIKSIETGKLRISPSICYEIAFDEHIRKTAKDSNILLTVSNDTWFGKSIGPIQHLEIAQNRALEHKKPLIRATNSGISAYVSKNGEIIESQTYFEDKTLTRNITLYSGHTFYSKYGNLPLLIFLVLYVSFISFKKLFDTNIK